MSKDVTSQDQDRSMERRVLRSVLKALWSLISSLGLVILGPVMLLVVLGFLGGSFDIGTVELGLIWLCWLIGIPTVNVPAGAPSRSA